jgi:hypothetical protein
MAEGRGRGLDRILVTTSDGRLVGILFRADPVAPRRSARRD